MGAVINAISSYLPSRVVTNEELAAEFSGWTAEKIAMKTGILSRHIAAEGELASDLAVHAVSQLFEENGIERDSVDALLYCTQSPDYLLPPTACILQHRLKLPRRVAALDFNLGCSGFVYGLGMAQALIASGQARRILLVTADTYSRYLHPGDRSVRTLFGDAAAAVCIDAEEAREGMDGPFIYGTDGSGAENLMVPAGGLRCPVVDHPEVITDSSGNQRTAQHLFMNGPEIFTFTLRVVPETVTALLERTGLGMEDIDLFVFHQANEYMLEHLRKRLQVPAAKFVVSMQDCGNTVSSTIPIALERAVKSGRLLRGMRVMLLGFGVGYSWAGTIIRW